GAGLRLVGAEWPVLGSGRTVLLEAAGAFVVALAARRPWFRYHRLFAVLLRFERRRTGLADMGAPGRAFSGPRACGCAGMWPGAFVRASGRAGAGRPWGQADRPCGIYDLLSLRPPGRCRTGQVIPSVGGVPELPALPIERTRDDRGREPE